MKQILFKPNKKSSGSAILANNACTCMLIYKTPLKEGKTLHNFARIKHSYGLKNQALFMHLLSVALHIKNLLNIAK